MVDDLLAVAPCNQKSLVLNTVINAQIELKKLKFHTPDRNGKSKCHVMHIGKSNVLCPTLQVHGTDMCHVTEDTYLGDIISCDGRNTKNVQNRIGKGLGKITEIMNILEKISFGHQYFKIALLLRESLFLNSILTNAEIWYGVTQAEIKHFEDLDLTLLRRVLNTPCSVPAEAIYLELGCMNIEVIIKSRRANYLHYLLRQSKSSMLYKVFITQWKYPAVKNEWTEQVKLDLNDLGLSQELSMIEGLSKNVFKEKVKKKAKEFAFFNFLEKKEKHSKLENLFYMDLKLQHYLQSETISPSEAQIVFNYRTRMSNYGENFRGRGGPSVCPLCMNHPDGQKWSFQCSKIRENIKIEGKYSNIFGQVIESQTVKTIVKISKFRTDYLDQRKLT